MRERRIRFHEAVRTHLVVPGVLVVLAGLSVVPGVDTFVESKVLADDEREVCVVLHVLVLDLVVRQQVGDHGAQENDVGSRPDRRIHIGNGG